MYGLNISSKVPDLNPRHRKRESGNFSRTFSRTFSSPRGKDPRKMGDFALSENPPNAANRGFTD
jgi:hypothetical protein